MGSGPAGVTLARKLAAARLNVALMEAGGLEYSDQSQDLYVGDCLGRDYYPLDITRLRYFGGTSGHWGGRCRPLETNDFEPRPYHALSGWPIRKSDLDPYEAEADGILDLPAADVLPDDTDRYAGKSMRVIRFRRSAPPEFGEKFRDEIAASTAITLVVNANLVDLELDPGLASVSGAVFRSYAVGDPGFTIRARAYCLCLGGLENPRFLLNANRQVPSGIGNENDLVGRYFSEHLAYNIGRILFEGEVPTTREYVPTLPVLDEHQVLDFELLVSTKSLSLHKELARSTICLTDFTHRLGAAVLGWSIDCDYGGVAAYVEQWSNREDVGSMGLIAEQSLNRDSRVLLTDQKDMFGLRRIALDWRINELDVRTVRTAGMILGQKYAENGAGRVQLNEWLLREDAELPQLGSGNGEVALHHHMCTTRMCTDPRQGVVDANCRVHSVSNLYVGGSSVFSTVGFANPTYTIVQLALRLGDHLSAELKA